MHKISSLVLSMAAIAAGLVVGGAARAAVSAQGEVTGLSFELVDLDPGDALAASATWLDGSALASGEAGAAGASVPFSHYAPSFGGPLSGGVSTANANAAASISAGGLRAGGGAADGKSFYASALTGYGVDVGGIVLGAKTGLRLRLSYELSAAVGGLDPGCTACDSAQVSLTAILSTDAGIPVFDSAQAAAFADFGPASDHVASAFDLRLDNAGLDPVTVSAGVTLIAQGEGFSAPVPEPATPVLLLAGAGLLGAAMATRRRARATAGRLHAAARPGCRCDTSSSSTTTA